jgi:hypothetical protein
MLSFRLYDHLEYLKPFLVYLNYWPERVEPIGIEKQEIIDSDINMDSHIVEVLRKI